MGSLGHVRTEQTRDPRATRYRIPVALNAVGTVAVPGLMLLSLTILAHAPAAWARAGALVIFSVLGHSLFSLIHEAEHDKLLSGRRANALAGAWLSAFFPAAFTVLRAAHLAHHARNRTDEELIDYYRPDESRLLKIVKYYGLLAGALWLGTAVLSVLLCFVPSRLLPAPSRGEGDADLKSYVSFVSRADSGRIRRETAFTIALWSSLTWLMGLGLETVAAYLIFGFVWSTQQFIYHVRTPLHLVEGSRELHMSPFFRLLFLNMNYHLTHHRHPRAPWTALPALADREPTESYFGTWWRSLLPPRPIECAWPRQFMAKGPLPEGGGAGQRLASTRR
jgi:fatty acid desaturase